MYFFIYTYYILKLAGRILFGLSLNEKKGAQFLKSIEVKFNGKFDSNTFKKANKMQSIQQFIINDSFANFENRHTNSIEQENNKLYFVLASLYDDMMDEKTVSKEALNEMFLNPQKANPTTFNEIVLIDTHLKLLNRVHDKVAYQKVLANIHQAQLDSLNQLNINITLDTILSITERKGGYSLLMCRHYINTSSNVYLDKCWYQLGGMIQMTNDLYDIYKDTLAGIYTFANTQNSFEKIRDHYECQVSAFKLSIHELDYKESSKLNFQIKLSLIPALGYIALENLKKLQGENNQLLPFTDYTRKDLIIDMEKIKNIVKLFKYSYLIAQNKKIRL